MGSQTDQEVSQVLEGHPRPGRDTHESDGEAQADIITIRR
jgi:hypothetical protein